VFFACFVLRFASVYFKLFVCIFVEKLLLLPALISIILSSTDCPRLTNQCYRRQKKFR